MRLRLNGEEKEVGQILTLMDLLRGLGIDPGAPGIAVAVNGRVIPRPDFNSTPVQEGDRIEVVRAVQGG